VLEDVADDDDVALAVGLEVAVDEMEGGVVAEAEAEDDAEAVAELEDVDVGDEVLLPGSR
jgi:hypothetical protein